ncbi:MAG TPA: AMP-binding protein [Bryobacteraceae bacterium]
MQSIPLAELARQATLVAHQLADSGLGRGDRIGVMANNSIEWILLDLAILKLGGVVAGFETGRFEPRAAIERYGLKRLFVDHAAEDDPRILPMDRVREWARGGAAKLLPLHDGYQPDDVCAIKFTSGSTGEPKGLEATVGSIDDSLSAVQEMFHHADGDNILVFLRLALLQQRYWIYSALAFGHDVTIANFESALSMAQLVHPTVIMAVPGFYEDVKRLVEAQSDDPPDRYRAIQAVFGGRIRYLWTGSAPAGKATLDFFNDCGVPLFQGYGLNETCIVAKNYPGANRVGSVGKVLPNKTVRFDAAGIVIVGSRHPVNTRFSWCAPGDNERMFLPTGEVITHDVGYFDDDGYLYILGRVDDIVVLSSGRNVLVRPLEDRLKQCAGVHECVLFGDGKPFLTAVVSPMSAAVDKKDIQSFIDAMNRALLPEQRIGGLVISSERFSMENGLLTSQFKPVRKEIHRRLAAEIDAM